MKLPFFCNFHHTVSIKNISNYIIRIDIFIKKDDLDSSSSYRNDLKILSKFKIADLMYIYMDKNSFDYQSPKNNIKLLDLI